MFNEIEQINWVNTYKVDKYISWDKDIIIYGVLEWVPLSMYNDLLEYILEWWNIPKFDENRKIIDNIYLDYILIEYVNKDIRNNDMKNNSHINIINPIKSETIDWDKQLAQNVWNFEYNNKYYLVVYPYNAVTDETDSEKWLYKWVIIDSDKYFEVNNQAKKTNSQVKKVLDK